MSTLKVDGIRSNTASSDAITLDSNGKCAVTGTTITGTTITADTGNFANLPNRNLVINGAMQVAQRDTGSGFTGVGQQEYTIDQFVTLHSYNSSTINVIHSGTSPDGFAKSYKVDVTAADTSVGNGEFMFIRHKIEAQNLQHLAYGTSSAKSITLSFYVRSNVTGTYAICLQQKDNSSKQVNGTYTINSADTWEKKTFTFAGDTSGVINNDNGHGLDILWTLVAGPDRTSGSARPTWTAHANADESVGHTANVLSSTSNEWYLTGVQLEVGSVATDFEHVSYADELRKCQRYFQNYITYAEYTSGGTGNLGMPITTLVTPMRASPTFTVNNESKSSNWTFHSFNFSQPPNSAARGYSYFQILINTSDSNYGYLRRYGNASAEL